MSNMDVEVKNVGGGGAATEEETEAANGISLTRLIFACTVAGGVQFGWALQLSLLTPYAQTLGLSHAMSSLVWLCGPIAGFLVQPCVGLYSDKCRSSFGRRRPFVLIGCIIICLSVVVIGFSSDIGYALGDTKEHCSVYRGSRTKAAIVYVVGFWVLDFANNAVQGPTRALMADFSGRFGCNTANAIFASWMALGNILGYASGSTNQWHKWFPFLKTNACCDACANLKAAFLVAVVFLIICMMVTMIVAKEVPLSSTLGKGEERAQFLDIFRGMKNLPPGMVSVLVITALTWFAWFPFIQFDTDWMGREVYHGDPKGTHPEIDAFNSGVRKGAFGLLLSSIVLGIGSFLIEPMCRLVTPRIVWSLSNLMLCIAMAAISLIGYWSKQTYDAGAVHELGPDGNVRAVALLVFTLLGLPMAVLYSVPFAVAATLASTQGGGQGLCTGVLNMSIVVPQVIVALGAGPFDELFSKGNTPAFVVASIAAFLSAVLGIFILPKLSTSTEANGPTGCFGLSLCLQPPPEETSKTGGEIGMH